MKGCYEAFPIKELPVHVISGQSMAFDKAIKSFHSGLCCDICQMKQFNVEKLFSTQACLHLLHYMYLNMSSS